jgi:hypothetical protein
MINDMGKKKMIKDDYLKASRRGSREAEIEMYGHPVSYHRIITSKKVYNRKKMKAEDKGSALFLLYIQI